jgi:plastocyanin
MKRLFRTGSALGSPHSIAVPRSMTPGKGYRARIGLVLAALIVQPVLLAAAASPVIVTQIGRAFSEHELRIRRGDIVRFSNADEFLHQIYVRAAAFGFSSSEQEPGRDVDVRFPVAGSFDVRCEIHPRMLLHVTVE